MDHTHKEVINEDEVNEEEKCCSDCKTRKTPLWRSGPFGPKSLCNACGIRYRKRRIAMVGSNKKAKPNKVKSSSTTTRSSAAAESSGGTGGNLEEEDLRARVISLGKEVVFLQRQKKRSPMKRQRKLGEVERAAVVLMALSCDSVFA